MNVGEVFIALGFDVDDKTLKGFNDGIKDTINGMLKLGGITASVAGFQSIMNGAADGATALRNFTAEFGYSQKSMQEYAAMLHYSNPLVSLEAAQASYRKISEYILSIKKGNGAFALNQLGISYTDNMTPEDIFRKIHDVLPGAIKSLGRDRTSDLINQITGSVGAITMFEKSMEELQEVAKKGVTTQEQNDALVRYNENLATLGISWNNFVTKVAGSIAPLLNEIVEAADKGGVKGAVTKIGEKSTFWDGIKDWFYDGVHSIASSGNGAKDSRAFWEARGYNKSAIAALLAQEQAESNFDPTAVGDGGKARGSFQWHAARAKNIKDNTGIDVSTANHWQQLRAAAWELENMGLSKKLKAITSSDDASRLLSRQFEIHAKQGPHGDEDAYRSKLAGGYEKTLQQNVTIHVNTTANAKETAEQVNAAIQKRWNYAYAELTPEGTH